MKSKAVQLALERGNKMPGTSEQSRSGRTLVIAQTRPLGAEAGFAVIAPKNTREVPWSLAPYKQGIRNPMGTAGEAIFDQSLPEQI